MPTTAKQQPSRLSAHKLQRSQLPWLSSGIAKQCRAKLLTQLADLPWGQIIIHEGDERLVLGNENLALGEASVQLKVHHHLFYAYTALGGDVGAGESYMQEHWDCTELTQLIRILSRNQAWLARLRSSVLGLDQLMFRGLHWLRRNNRSNAKKNIAAHYDLGNDFFALWLDKNMMYSSGIYLEADTSLDDAQFEKVDRICRKLALNKDHHVLEIGSGWGGFALHAARRYGCKVTTVTISQAQYDLAAERISAAGLQKQITLLLRDYRDLSHEYSGQFDKLVSIEMIEAVGHEHFAEYFSHCSKLLKADGQLLIQAITTPGQDYAEYLQRVDFIQRYIFPGGSLPSVLAMETQISAETDLNLVHYEDIGFNYAKTLADWRQNFEQQRPRIEQLGYDERFIRMWRFYLCLCEAAFTERQIGTAQIIYAKPLNRAAVISF